jgi:hypothetical protein
MGDQILAAVDEMSRWDFSLIYYCGQLAKKIEWHRGLVVGQHCNVVAESTCHKDPAEGDVEGEGLHQGGVGHFVV